MEKVRNDIYNIYKGYSLKHITSEKAIKDIIDYISDVNNYSKIPYTKHMHSLLVQLVVKLIMKINPKHDLFYKFLESNIVDTGLTTPTRYYLYHIVEQYFPTKIESLQRFIITSLPTYFPDNIEFDGVEVNNAGLHAFLFQTHETLSTYFSHSHFKWNYNFNGFSNGSILIVKKENDPYANEDFSVEHRYDTSKIIIKDGEKFFFIGINFLIPILQLGFALQIYKLIINNFEESSLLFNFPSAPEIPIKTSYKNSDILLFFYKTPVTNDSKLNKKIFELNKKISDGTGLKRSEVIDFNCKRAIDLE